MAQSDARFGYKAKLSRADHDLSQPFGFSTPPGFLNPIFADIASPGDTYYINHDLEFLRTAPLAAPAMIDVKVHYESFFVPMQMIYQPFEQTVFSIQNVFSSQFNNYYLQGNTFPTFDFWHALSRCITVGGTARTMAFRLCDLLDLNALNLCNDTTTLDSDGYVATETYTAYKYHPSFFPWQLLAYHTIFNYYYRLDDKTQFDVKLCNFDQYYGNTNPVQMESTYEELMFYIHSRPWNFDYFTSSYRSPIVSAVNTQTILPQGQYSDLISRNTAPITAAGATAIGDNNGIAAYSSVYASGGSNIQQAYSTALIRQAFANEKLAMITGRTRKNYDSQVLAHYGVKVPHDVKHDISLIGQDTYRLHVGEVTSLASTTDSALGDLAGKGFASGKSDKPHKFTAPCHGVVMTIFSIEPVQRYYGGFNRYNAVDNAVDLPLPEFDRLGNQPVYQYEAGVVESSQTMTQISAWKERYYYFKRRKPRVSIGFWNPANYAGTGGNPNDVNDWEPYFISSWAYGARGRSTRSSSLLQDSYYIQPECMDALMLVPMRLEWGTGAGTPADENWNKFPHLAYCHDPFIVDSNIKVKKVSWMSKDGEPVYPY